MMGASKLRLGVAMVLFLAWLGWLLYLAIGTRDTVVLSRPQFLVSPLWVLARVDEKHGRPAAEVIVRDVVWSARNQDLAGKKIVVGDLPSFHAAVGWSGPGDYILPLSAAQAGKTVAYRVTPLPLSPGFPGPSPAYFTVTLIAEGPDSKVRELVAQFSGLDPKDIDRLLAPKARAVFRNVPKSAVRELEKLKASFRSHPEESRIYPATAETRAQLNEMPHP